MGLFRRRNSGEEIAQQAATAAVQAMEKQLSNSQQMHLAYWKLGEGQNSLSRPFKQLPLINAVINAKATRISRVPIRFYRPGTDNEQESSPVIDLLNRPAPNMNKALFLQALVINKEISGEYFIYKDEEMYRGAPRGLWVYPRGSYDPKFIGQGFSGWRVNPPNGSNFDATDDDVIFDRYYHPYDQLRGLSPMDALWIAMDTEWEARRFNHNFFKNDATPGQTYTTDQQLVESQYERLKQALIDDREGVESSHKGLILDGGLKPVTASFSQKDAQFIEQMNLTLHDICAVYRVDPAIIGFEEQSKYASVKEARRYLWTDVLIPEMHMIEQKLNKGLLGQYNLEMRFDTTNIEALAYTMTERVDAAKTLWEMGFTANEINERLDLGFEEIPERDEPKPQQPQPLQQMDADRHGSTEQKSDVDLSEAHKAHRAKVWKEVTDKVRPTMAKLRKQLRAFFHDVEKKVERELSKQVGDNAVTKGIEDEIDIETIGAAVNEDKLERIVTEFIQDGGKVGYESILERSFDVIPRGVMQYVKGRGEMIKEVARNARKDIQAAVEDAVREVVDEGMGEQAAADLIRDKLKDKMSQIDRRTRTIARTEVHSAFSSGRQDAMAETEPTHKRWISARDANVRDSHMHLDGDRVRFEETFANGLRYPLDPKGAADEVINCRCIVQPEYDED